MRVWGLMRGRHDGDLVSRAVPVASMAVPVVVVGRLPGDVRAIQRRLHVDRSIAEGDARGYAGAGSCHPRHRNEVHTSTIELVRCCWLHSLGVLSILANTTL